MRKEDIEMSKNATTPAVSTEQLWRKEGNGIIRFAVTSNGMTGPEWIEHLKNKGCDVVPPVENILRSKQFEPTKGITTEIAVVTESILSTSHHTLLQIKSAAKEKGMMGNLNLEIACLIRDSITREDILKMGLLYLVVMHRPVVDGGTSFYLAVCGNHEAEYLATAADSRYYRWGQGYGFAFTLSS